LKQYSSRKIAHLAGESQMRIQMRPEKRLSRTELSLEYLESIARGRTATDKIEKELEISDSSIRAAFKNDVMMPVVGMAVTGRPLRLSKISHTTIPGISRPIRGMLSTVFLQDPGK
jgi:hypothetical protein